GIGSMVTSIAEMSLADWRRQTAVNLDGVFLSVKYCLPLMRRSGGGSIIMTSSIAGLRGSATLAGYCATKGGVRLFGKAIAMECAARGDNIRVNTVHPGIIDTPIWSKIRPDLAGGGRNAPIDIEEIGRASGPSAGSVGRRISPTASCSSPPTPRITSPAPSSSSMAALPAARSPAADPWQRDPKMNDAASQN